MADAINPRIILDGEGAAALRDRVSVEEVAAAWCRYIMRAMLRLRPEPPTGLEWTDDPDGWAAELYFEQEFWDIERRKEFVCRAAELAPNDDVLLTVGAGPLEDLTIDDEARLLWIEDRAAASGRFRKALQNVQVSGLKPETISRLERAAGAALAGGSDVGS